MINCVKRSLLQLAAIKRVEPFVPQSTLPYIYNSLVQSHFDCCSLIWGNCDKTLSNNLQNRAARVITSSNYDVDVDSLQTQLERLESQRQNSERLNGFQTLKRAGSRISHV